ncbi:MAG: hypothetical protein QOE00_2090, partial [Ilumatobacteraceae bacterium]
MSEVMEHDSIDDRAQRAAKQVRSTASTRSLPELPVRLRRRGWLAPLVASATVVIVVIGLILIGTNRNDRTVGNDGSRFHWIVTHLPDRWNVEKAFDPLPPGDRRPPLPLDNVYATDSAPEGPVLQVSGNEGSESAEIVPGQNSYDETNYQELTIGGRRAAIADGRSGLRVMYIEIDGHWIRLRSRHIDDASLTRLAEAAVRNADTTAMILPEKLINGLKLVVPAGTAYDPSWLARVDGAATMYGVAADPSANLGLSVSVPAAGTRAGVGLSSEVHRVAVGQATGYSGSFEAIPATTSFRTLYWERDGLAFYLLGVGISDADLLDAATSIRPAHPDEWAK